MSYNDPAAATGSSTTNPFYLVQALDSLDTAANVIGASNRTGEFTFDLTPGAE